MHKTLSATAARFARRLGYEVVPAWRLDQYGLEQHLKDVFRKFSVGTVFDVGANVGQFRDFLRQRVGFDGAIHSFEPVSRLAARLADRAKADARWRIHQFALGESNTTMEINVAASDTFSSFLDARAAPDSPFASSMAVRERERVTVKRGDDVWPGLIEDAGNVYLKVDTQGFDMTVLRGSKNLMQALPAFQFELPVQPLYQGTPHYLDILKELEDWGFVLSGLFPITTNDRLQIVECDCVMVARR